MTLVIFAEYITQEQSGLDIFLNYICIDIYVDIMFINTYNI